MDGITFAIIEAAGLETWLSDLRMDLAAKTYKAAPVRRVVIPKPGGGERPLGIPTIRDRVVQTSAVVAAQDDVHAVRLFLNRQMPYFPYQGVQRGEAAPQT